MLEAAAAMRFFSAALSLFTYKLLYWSERPISTGSVFALMLLSASVTALVTTDLSALLEGTAVASSRAMSLTRTVVLDLFHGSDRDEL